MNEALIQRAGAPFSEWQQSLAVKNLDKQEPGVRDEVGRRQRELREAIAGGAPALAGYLRGRLGIDGAAIEAPPFPRDELTPDEFRDPPIELERQLAAAWGEIRPGEASQPLFWLLCHIVWLEQGRFGSGPLSSAFTATASSLDGETRNFLRRSGGIYVRGNVTAFSDCPLARAWWRHRVAVTAGEAAGRAISEAAHRTLHDNRPAWETLVLLSLRRITAINQPRARAALVDALIDHGRPDRETVHRIAGALARQGLSRSLEHTPWEELREIAARAAAEDA